MWDNGILGEWNPEQLRDTVLFLIGLHVGLHAGDEQYSLWCDGHIPSQIQFKRNESGVRCLVYTEDSVTKTNDGGLSSMNKERKVVLQKIKLGAPSESLINTSACYPLCVMEKRVTFTYVAWIDSLQPSGMENKL